MNRYREEHGRAPLDPIAAGLIIGESDIDDDILASSILVASEGRPDDLRELLNDLGYAHLSSENDAEHILDSYASHRPRLVIVDVDRLGGVGIDLIERIGAMSNGACGSILALTAGSDSASRRAAIAAGAKDVISRPVDPIETAARIRNRLEFCALMEHVHHQNASLERTIKERTRALNASHLDLVHRLARAAEFRDNDTGHHVARMSLYAAELGRAAGLSEHECQLLLNASALHDIGKIGIADRVLLKPGAHSPEETRAMRTHVEMGVAILSGSEHELLQWAEVIARTHHERWDGTGYPAGLHGEEIPLIGRVVAICDVFDALTSLRPYKRAWPVDAAVNEIRQGSGTHFDPNLVALFFEILPRLTMIQNSYAAALSEFYT